MDLSIVLPVYNEAKNLEKSLIKIEEFVRPLKYRYEIIVAEDGSTDGTYEIAKKISREKHRIKVLHSINRLGKGLSLRKAFSAASGEKIVFMDIDLSTDLKHLLELVSSLEHYDIVIGSRWASGSIVRSKIHRRFFSFFFNLLTNFLFFTKIRDHQCGFKGFRKEVWRRLSRETEERGFLFDTEFLVKSRSFKIKEIPVEWTESEESKIDPIKESIRMGLGLIKLRVRTI